MSEQYGAGFSFLSPHLEKILFRNAFRHVARRVSRCEGVDKRITDRTLKKSDAVASVSPNHDTLLFSPQKKECVFNVSAEINDCT